MAYPTFPSGGSSGPRPLGTRRKVRKLRMAVRSGASNKRVNMLTRRAIRSVNQSQRQGTYGTRSRRAVKRTIRTLTNDNSIYSKRSGIQLRRASLDRHRQRPVGRKGHGTDVGPKGPHGHYHPPGVKNPRPHPHKKRAVKRGNNGPGVNRPAPGHPHKGNGPGKQHQGPGKGHPRPHHGKGPGKGKGPKEIKLGKPGKRLAKRITNVTENRFLYANENRVKQQVAKFRKRRKYIVKHTKNKKREKKLVKIARKNMMSDVRKRGTGASPLYRKAGLAVSAELDPQLKALTTRIKQTRRDKKRTAQDLKGLFQRALEQHRGYKENIDTGAREDISTTRDQFDNLVNKIASGYDQSESSVRDELSRLGIGEAAPASTAALNRDKQYSTSLASRSGAESVAEQRTNQEGYDQLMSLLGGEISTTGLGARTEARQKFTDALMKYRDQRSALAATRLGKISTAAEALRAAKAQARSEALQNALARKMAAKNFQLDVAKFKAGVRDTRTDNRLNQLKYELDRAQWMADQLKSNTKHLPKKSSYSNSRNGAIDYLRSRGAPKQMVDRYISFAGSADRMGTISGPFGIPIPIPNNIKGNDNNKVNVMVKQMISKGMPRKFAKIMGDALRIEWGLI